MSLFSTYSAASVRDWQNYNNNYWRYYATLDNSFLPNISNIENAWSCAISDNGNTAVTGSRFYGYVEVYTGSDFSTRQQLGTPTIGSDFGQQLDINGLGNIIAIGNFSNSQAIIYTNSSNTWTLSQTLTGIATFNISLNQNGNYLAILGAGNGSSNAVGVYTLTGGTYTKQANIAGDTTGAGGLFGITCKLNAAGDYIISANVIANSNKGQVFISTRTANTWALQQTITASDVANSDQFGGAGDINNNGDIIVIGSPRKTIGALTDAGSAYVFKRTGNTWTQTQILQPDTPKAFSNFGSAISINGDGTQVMINSAKAGSLNQYGVFIFNLINNNFVQTQTLVSPIGASEFFGSQIDIAKQTNDYAIITGPHYSLPAANAGHAYIYTTL